MDVNISCYDREFICCASVFYLQEVFFGGEGGGDNREKVLCIFMQYNSIHYSLCGGLWYWVSDEPGGVNRLNQILSRLLSKMSDNSGSKIAWCTLLYASLGGLGL